jgi:hypothetical protein
VRFAKGTSTAIPFFRSCAEDVAANPQYASLAKHTPLDRKPEAVTLEQKADQALATPQEAKLVLAWRPDIGKCRSALNETQQAVVPTMMPAILEAQNEADGVWIKVAHREMSWGAALQQIGQISTAALEKTQQAGEEIMADLNQQQAA